MRANVSSMSGLIWHWMMPSMSYSTGSSAVISLLSIVVQLAEGGVERRRLAGAGRAGDDHDAVGLVDELAERAQVVLAQAQLVQVEADVAAVEHAHDDALAEHRRQHADAEVDRLVVDVQLDAAVLRHAALGDVQVGHDLDARADGGGDVRRRRHHLVEDAVDAVAHLELVLERLEVDVRGLVLDRLQEHEVDQLADGVGVGGALDRVQVERLAAVGQVLEGGVVLQVVEDVGDALGGGVVVLLDELVELLGVGQHRVHVVALEVPQVVECAEVLVGRHRDGQLLIGLVEGDREDLVGRRDLGGDGLDHFLGDVAVLQADHLVAELGREGDVQVGGP